MDREEEKGGTRGQNETVAWRDLPQFNHSGIFWRLKGASGRINWAGDIHAFAPWNLYF